MPRGLILLFVLFLILMGSAVLLSRSVDEQPTRTIEVEVIPSAAPR